MFVINSQRLSLRTINKSDIEDVMQFWGDREVMAYCFGSTCQRSDIEEAIDRFKEMQVVYHYSVYGVEENEHGKLIGACGFKTTEKEEKVELIYHLNKMYWGKGYATEAVKAAIEYIKGINRIRIIEASVYPENYQSIKVLKKIGFKYVESQWIEDSKCDEPFYQKEIKHS